MRPLFARLTPLFVFVLVLLPALSAALILVRELYGVPVSEHALRFERPWAALLFLAPVLALLSRGVFDAERSARVGMSRGEELGALPKSLRVRVRPVLYGLRATALTLAVLGLMGPQSIHARDRSELEGIDIVLTIDLSLSMQAADITPNRFEATKYVVDDFIARRPNDRIGAVVFGRDAYTLMPLTTDKDMLRGAVADLELGMIEGRGTAIGNAVGVALNRLKGSRAKSKAVILMTDGDSNSGNISPEEAAEFATNMGVKVYAVLMGRDEESRVQRGVDLFGRPLFGQGNFPVNPELLKRMAQKSGGEFYLVSDRQGLERSFHAILDKLEKSEVEDAGAVYGELFPAFLGPALLLLFLEAVLGTTWLRRWP